MAEYIPDIMFVIAFLLLGAKMYQTIGMINRRTHQDPKLNPLQKDPVEPEVTETVKEALPEPAKVDDSSEKV